MGGTYVPQPIFTRRGAVVVCVCFAVGLLGIFTAQPTAISIRATSMYGLAKTHMSSWQPALAKQQGTMHNQGARAMRGSLLGSGRNATRMFKVAPDTQQKPNVNPFTRSHLTLAAALGAGAAAVQ